MKSTNIGDELAVNWSKVIDCISATFLVRLLMSARGSGYFIPVMAPRQRHSSGSTPTRLAA